MQRTHQGFSKALSQAIYFQQSMQQKKADSKKTPGEKSLKAMCGFSWLQIIVVFATAQQFAGFTWVYF